jgi:hypothetical protein
MSQQGQGDLVVTDVSDDLSGLIQFYRDRPVCKSDAISSTEMGLCEAETLISYLCSAKTEIDRLRTLLSSSRGEQGWREALVTASMALTAHNDWQLKRTDPEVLDGVEYIPAEAYAESTLYELTDDALSRIKACEAGSVPTSLAGQVPDGYVLVPKEATDEMYRAALRVTRDPENGHIADFVGGAVYRAMLSAAPQPTAGGDAP